ncbi:hypothetical protein [Xylella fastidiosa]|uniref:hypothetical protein n=1 Tax=Xylella fastidiosa TaxID=2371 RepID=UPI002367639A|nr:hypothetical protein [Xylella fastidiosa]WDN62372.1 hypothetical protein LOK86_00020 [Xylella fastidiosa subsp. multiplex]
MYPINVLCWFQDRLSGVAQFEREMMLERQREGVARAKVRASTRGVTHFSRAEDHTSIQ